MHDCMPMRTSYTHIQSVQYDRINMKNITHTLFGITFSKQKKQQQQQRQHTQKKKNRQHGFSLSSLTTIIIIIIVS